MDQRERHSDERESQPPERPSRQGDPAKRAAALARRARSSGDGDGAEPAPRAPERRAPDVAAPVAKSAPSSPRAPRVAAEPRRSGGADLPPPELVTDDAALRRLLEHLGGEPRIAIDTEADSFFSYRERVCLIQVSTRAGDFVVDPLAPLDLGPFGRMLADPRRTKIFHDGEYDVLLLRREYGFGFAALFDTRVAAAALGYETVGLAAVLGQHFGVQLDKTQQLSDWSRRPLSPQQIDYARLDTHYLLRLADELQARLADAGREVIVAGECRRLEALEPSQKTFDPDECLRLKGARALDLARLQVLRELFVVRDTLARERNVPPFKVLSHGALVEIARRRPKDERELAAVPEVSPKHVQRIGKQLLGAVRRGRELGPLERLPRLPSKDGTDRLDERGHELHERLKGLRKSLAEREGYDASLVLNRLTLLDLADKAPTTESELDGIAGLLDWQRAAFGAALVDTIARFVADWDSGAIEPKRQRRRRS
jgi:ribonuclease D